jgi:hypothetical protein
VAWIRRVRTASGATAVQIAEHDGGRRKIVAHVGPVCCHAQMQSVASVAARAQSANWNVADLRR